MSLGTVRAAVNEAFAGIHRLAFGIVVWHSSASFALK
jgi:hypothetical protein